MKFKIAIVFVSLFVGVAVAANSNDEGKKFASETHINTNINPFDIPGYTGEKAPQEKYYDYGLNIENEARKEAANDPTAQYINNAHESRPTIKIDPQTDPLFKRHDDIRDQAISLTDTYSGCVDLPVGDKDITIYDEKSCHIEGNYHYTYPECHRTYKAQCSNGSTYHEPFTETVSINLGSKGRDYFTAEVDFKTGSWKAVHPSDGITKVVHIKPVDFDMVCKHNNTTITYKGVNHWPASVNFVGGGRHDNTVIYRELQRPSCANGLNGKYQIEDTNKGSDTEWVLGGTFIYQLHYVAKCDISFNESYSCNIGGNYAPEQLQSRACVDSGEKLINGFKVYKDCWDWKEIFEVEEIKYTEQPECQVLQKEGCGFVTGKCNNLSSKNDCLDEELIFSCPRLEAERKVSLCGSNLICPDGNCTNDIGQSYEPANDDFKKAATALAVADEISKQIDMDTLTVFKGDDGECKEQKFGFVDCCKGSGWGASIGLTQCTADEKKLGMAREAEKTHYVGSYTTGGILDKRTHRVFCIFPSKLARILVQQSAIQLNKNFGSAREPNCAGLTLSELDEVDFQYMDLSEYYSDVINKAQGSDAGIQKSAGELQDKLQNRFK